MCAYGSINGTNVCSDASIYELLQSWGFNGFVRSDLDAVRDPAAAYTAGLALIKPISGPLLTSLVDTGAIPMSALDAAVSHTLTAMFAFGLIASPRPVTVQANVASTAHGSVALRAAEASMVLLKNQRNVLPLTAGTRSVAVIGSDAGTEATTSGRGSSQVRAATVVTSIRALEAALGGSTRITYTPADSPRLSLPPIPARDLIGTPLPTQTPLRNQPGGPYAPGHAAPGTSDLHLATAPNVTPAAETASQPGTGAGWSSWSAALRVPVSGTYEFSIEQSGDTWLNLDGQNLIASPGLHGRSLWSTTASLVGGRTYRLSVNWFAVANQPMPQLGFADVSPEIAAATDAARHASVAVIFASVSQSEGVDRPSLNLPGDANALISSVAAVNRRTVVVLNSGGAVLMPWINRVAAVLEAWYPGQEDGTATAAVLDGQVDPSGHLPVTFPAVSNPSPVGTPAQYPGVDATVDYNEGLDIGYRWFAANDVKPLFPFGFGLSYTSFTLSNPTVQLVGDEVVAGVTVTNTGARAGTAVVQAYLRYPKTAGEPPDQLRAFGGVALKPGQSRAVNLTMAASAFEADINGSEQVVPGPYSVDIGQSSADLPIHLRAVRSLNLPRHPPAGRNVAPPAPPPGRRKRCAYHFPGRPKRCATPAPETLRHPPGAGNVAPPPGTGNVAPPAPPPGARNVAPPPGAGNVGCTLRGLANGDLSTPSVPKVTKRAQVDGPGRARPVAGDQWRGSNRPRAKTVAPPLVRGRGAAGPS